MPTAIIGVALANELGLGVGDVVTLGESSKTTSQQYRIAGTFDADLDDHDAGLVYVHFRELQRTEYGGHDLVAGIDVRLAEPLASQRLQRTLERTIGPAGYIILEWQSLHAELLATQRAHSGDITTL